MIGVDNRTGPQPALVARDIRRIHRLKAAGATVPQIAEVMAVSKRTVYRYLESYLVTKVVAGHALTFLVRPGRQPVLLTERRA